MIFCTWCSSVFYFNMWKYFTFNDNTNFQVFYLFQKSSELPSKCLIAQMSGKLTLGFNP